ncbi:S8 family serine peptidase [Microbacterium koreense]|uniref:S8 family serine peptidase n=1 Tax=Microbacterium koreense TaxID=323761 RepID=A0ABW2ZN30_9MICO
MTEPRNRRVRILAAGAAIAGLMIGAIAAPAGAAPPPPPDFTATALEPDGPDDVGAKSASGRLAESDEALLARTDRAVIPILVKVDVDPVASYTGGVDGYAATSPEVTGIAISDGSAAIDRYTAYVEEQIAAAQSEASELVSGATMLRTYSTVYGGFAMTIPAHRAKDVAKLGTVAAVQANELRQATAPAPEAETEGAAPEGEADPEAEPTESATPQPTPTQSESREPETETTPEAETSAPPVALDVELPPTTPAPDSDATTFIGADAVWPKLGGRDKAGEGIIVGVIDSGIWPEHPMLQDNGISAPEGGPWGCEFGDGSVGDAFTCNDKLIGAYAFLDTYQSTPNAAGAEDFCAGALCSARDSDGHGTHTATTAAGSYVDTTPIYGVDRGAISGVAPGASIIAYRALGPAGGYDGDLLAAIGQTVLDGVDVINYSISGSQNPYDAVELAFLDAFAAGITVNSSAGNSGPGASTLDHASPWTTTVGASTSDRAFLSALVLASSNGETLVKQGTTITAGAPTSPVVRAQDVPGYTGTELCLEPFAPGVLAGQIVLCMRGENGRVEKGYHASLGGAEGMILANPVPQDLQTDNHFLPAIQLEGPNDDVVAFITDNPDVTATWAQGEAVVAPGDVMAAFSSRGPVGDFLKPDITAPGVQVLAGNTPEPSDPAVYPGELYQAIAGTSMSAPHAAGVSALVKASHPSWTPGQIKSALMTSSLQDVVNVDGSEAGVFDRGAGSIRADRAIAPVLTISESLTDFQESAADPLHRVDLNIPSVYVDPLPGAIATERTVTNVSGRTQLFSVRAQSEAGVRITVVPSSFALAPGKSRTLKIVLDALEAEDGWHEGQITITPRSGNAVVIPVAANVAEADVSFSQTCDPMTIERRATTTCTVTAANYLPVPVDARIDVAATPLLQVRSVTAPAKKTFLGARWSGTLSPAIPPQITGVDPATGYGYIPLEAYGIPLTPLGDEAMVSYNVPSFLYGGEAYDRISVVSNGYIVVGGGTDADIDYLAQSFPDQAAPNNVIAPFWTDLDPSAGGGVRVGTLGDGVNTWVIIEWDGVPTWSGNAVNTFQAWIGISGTEDTRFTYGTDAVPDAAAPGVAGAENRDGTSGVALATLPTAGDEYAVTTSPSTAGGTVTFDYTLRGLIRGTWSTVAVLRSDALRSTPMELTRITVE